ncbi:unnamed protein product [Peronospora destructor]|uniref:PX domain-containing protein n=1 Tax=Peronospora destructor TaxID=86335 RepID=A0AAV0SXN8_9STRA|nr:unnamed protein product [Peronospora destructor]
MPGQFVDVVAVASPTTLALNLKDHDEPRALPLRGVRSQSLSKLSRRASTASVLTIENKQCDTFSEKEENELEQQQRIRHARRALSSGTGSSLSLLQEELGYPRRVQVTPNGHSLCPSQKRRIIFIMNALGHLTSATYSPRSDVVDTYGDVPDDDENFMNYRSASVTGYSRDTDGVVYYEVIVRNIARGPLSAYKVRRRYSEFRDLHVALSKVMPVSYRKFASVTTMASISDESNNDEDEDVPVRLRCSSTDCSESKEPTLPPLPDKGGMWSYLLFDSIPLLERRAKHFNAMLTAAQEHPIARASRLLNDFVGTPPDLISMHSSVESSYVSLNRFAAPKLSFDIEIQERKEKAESIRRRRSSLKRQSFTGSLDASFISPRPLE